MKKRKKTYEEIFMEIATQGSQFDTIIDNILQSNNHQKNELISELYVQLYSKKDLIENLYQKKQLKFYLIAVITTQIKSNSSDFHKNNRQTLNCIISKRVDSKGYDDEINSGMDVDEHHEFEKTIEERRRLFEKAYKKTEQKTTWIENQIAQLHLKKGLSFRAIEQYFDGAIKYNWAHKIWKKWKVVFDAELKNMNI